MTADIGHSVYQYPPPPGWVEPEHDPTVNAEVHRRPDLTHVYEPRGACRSLFEHRESEVLVSGPAGTGKSRACLEKMHVLALVNPGMRGLIVRKTAVSLASSALVTWKRDVVVEALRSRLVEFYGGSAQEPAQYRYSNGSVITIGGLDKATRIMSTDYDVVFVQEATELTEGDWEALLTRLRNGRISFQQLIADCNPSTPTHWLKARCDRGQTTMLESRHEDNPLLFDEHGVLTERGGAYLAKLDSLTGVRYDRLRKGLWVAAEGIIYEDWDPAVHVLDRSDLPGGRVPPEWTRYWVVDFGFTNPFVCQWWAEDPDGRLYMYREIYHTHRLVEDHARQILGQVTGSNGRWLEPKPRAVICDHDAEDRATLTKHLGFSTVAARKSVSDGIQAVASRLKPADDDRPRLFLLRDALVERDEELVESGLPTCTVEEVPGYVWQPTPDGKPNKETPLKADDHGCDCTRYVVAHLDKRNKPQVRFV